MSLTKCNDAIGFQNQENEGFVCAAAFAYLMYRDLLLICNCNCVISIHILKSTLKPNVFSCKLYCNERMNAIKYIKYRWLKQQSWQTSLLRIQQYYHPTRLLNMDIKLYILCKPHFATRIYDITLSILLRKICLK